MFNRVFLTKLTLFLLFILLVSSSFASAAFNPQINYQGKLAGSTGAVVADGNYDIEFNLYTVSSGGSPIWTETRNGGNQVAVTNGLFSVMLGEVSAISGVDFNQTLYLGVKVGVDSEMTPRKKLGTVPAAFEAKRLEGLGSAQFLRSDSANSTSTASTYLSLTQSGAGKIAEFFGPASASVFSILSTGNIGIGTTTPYAKLSVAGNVVAQNFTATSTATSTLPTLSVTGRFYDGSGTAGANGYVLQTTGSGVTWVATTSLGFGSGSGTVGTGTIGQIPYYAANGTTVSATSTLFISVGGNVGIGTTSPYAKLSVAGQVVGEYFTVNSTTATSTIGAGGLAVGTSTPFSNGLFIVGTSTPSIFVSRSSGNVGIGTILPEKSLEISGGINATESVMLRIRNPNTDSGTGTAIDFFNTTGTGNDTFAGARIAAVRQVDSSNDLLFYSNQNVTPTERIRIKGSTGNIGIGTSSPYARLSVAGNVVAQNFTATSTATSTLPTLSVTGRFYDGSGTAGANGYVLQTTGSGVTWVATTSLGFGSGSGTVGTGTIGQIPYYAANGTTVSATSSLLIAANGNISMGTSTIPAGGTTLFVSGSGGSTAQFQRTINASNSFTQVDIVQPEGAQNIGDGFSLITLGSTYSTSGAFVADSAFFGANAGLSGGFSIVSSHGLGAIRFYTGGSASGNERLRIAPTGQVGVGTTTPTATLTVVSGATGSSTALFTGFSASQTADIFQIAKNPGAAAGLVFTAGGNLGIGTTSPYSKLSVWGSGTGTNQLFSLVNNASTTILQALDNGNIGIGTTTPAKSLTVGNNSWGEYIRVGHSASVLNAGIGIDSTGEYGLTMYIRGTPVAKFADSDGGLGLGVTYSQSATIPTGGAIIEGNVGIGTTSPYAKLSVVGQVVAANFSATTTATSTFRGGILTYNNTNWQGGAGNDMWIASAGNSSGVGAVGFKWSSGGLTVRLQDETDLLWPLEVQSMTASSYNGTWYGNAVGALYGGTGVSTFGGTNTILYTSSADTLASNSGFVFTGTNLGIGTTSPNWKLSVAGSASFDNFARASYFTATSTATSTFPTLSVTGRFYDSAGTAGANGYILQTTGSGVSWVATTSLGISGSGSGTVNTGTTGQIAYYAGSGTAVTATSTLFINTAGNVTVGTTTQFGNSRLTVDGGAYFTQAVLSNSFNVSGTSNTAYLGVVDDRYYGIFDAGDQKIAALDDVTGTFLYGNEQLVVTGSGNVGIGSSTPSATLVVQGSTDSTHLIVKGNSVQNEKIQEWQNSLGVVLASVDAYGEGVFGAVNTPSVGESGANGAIDIDFYNTEDAEKITFNVADVERMIINTNGNIGIGTTSPYAKLSVVGNVVAQNFTATSTSATSTFSGGFSAASSLYVLQNGNIGLRTSAPIGTGSTTMHIAGTAVTATSYGSLSLSNNGNTNDILGSLDFYGNNTRQAAIQAITTSPGSSADLYFMTQSSGALAEKMRIIANGNVGIGTTSPYAKLSVVGQVVGEYFTATSTTATSTFLGVVAMGGVSGSNMIGVVNITSATKLRGIQSFVSADNSTAVYGNAMVGANSIGVEGAGTQYGVYGYGLAGVYGITEAIGGIGGHFVGEAGDGSDYALYAEGARSYFSDNVGIGTTSPYAKLSVVGQVVGEYFTATSTATSTFPTLSVTGRFYDSAGTAGANGYVLQTTGSGVTWVATSSLNISSGSGTVGSGTTGQIPYYAANGTTLSATSTLFISTNGYVGIGTSSPTANLHISQTKNAATSVYVQNSSGGTSAFASFLASNGSQLFEYGMLGTGYTTNGMFQAGGAFLNSNSSAGMNFISQAAGIRFATGGFASSNERLTISSTGNVGVGTSSPYAKLSVAGQVVGEYFNATSTSATSTFAGGLVAGGTTGLTVLQNGNVGIGTTSPTAKLHIVMSSNTDIFKLTNTTGYDAFSIDNGTLKAKFYEGGLAHASLGFGGSRGLGGDGSGIGLITSDLTRMTVTSSGSIGIGTTSPFAKLAIHANNGETRSTLFEVASSTATATTTLFRILNNGFVGIGTSTPISLVSIYKNGGIASTSSQTIGISQYFKTDLAGAGTQYGNDIYIVNAPTVNPNILVGSMVKVEDNTSLANTVRGLEVQSHRGTNTQGENTALSGFARTFGVRGTTEGDAGGVFLPAGLFGQTRGTTQGNAVRAYSGSITSADLAYIFHDTSAFTGSALRIDVGNSGGTFTGNFLRMQLGGTNKFVVSYHGTTTIGDGVNQAGLQIGYGGICVDNDGTCTASTTGRISAVQLHSSNSDLAEMYFSNQTLAPGEIISTAGSYNIERANDENKDAIIGIVSTKPGLLIGADDKPTAANSYPVAISGRVPVKVSTESGAIKVGDKIALSSIDGVGMKLDKEGSIVGIALESFDGTEAVSEAVIDALEDNNESPDQTEKTVIEEDPCFLSGGGAIGEQKCKKQSEAERTKTSKATVRATTTPEVFDEEIGVEHVDGKTVKIGTIQVFVSFGWHRPTEVEDEDDTIEKVDWAVDTDTGELSSPILDSIDGGYKLSKVKSIMGVGGMWFIDENGSISAENIEAKNIRAKDSLQVGDEAKPIGITIFDTVTNEPYCMMVASGAMATKKGKCGALQPEPQQDEPEPEPTPDPVSDPEPTEDPQTEEEPPVDPVVTEDNVEPEVEPAPEENLPESNDEGEPAPAEPAQ